MNPSETLAQWFSIIGSQHSSKGGGRPNDPKEKD